MPPRDPLPLGVSSAELRRRASVLYRQSRETADPEVARLLTLRALRMMNEANVADGLENVHVLHPGECVDRSAAA